MRVLLAFLGPLRPCLLICLLVVKFGADLLLIRCCSGFRTSKFWGRHPSPISPSLMLTSLALRSITSRKGSLKSSRKGFLTASGVLYPPLPLIDRLRELMRALRCLCDGLCRLNLWTIKCGVNWFRRAPPERPASQRALPGFVVLRFCCSAFI